MRHRILLPSIVLTFAAVLAAQDAKPPIAEIVRPEPEPVPPALKHYKGREIAQTMHWLGAQWLWRATREDEEHVSEMLAQLKIKKGMTVCDLGAGSGYHALRMAEAVGPEGIVLAVDIQEKMLELLKVRADRAGVTNIRRILGQVHNPHLKPESCDLILMVDVYHEVSHPEHILRHCRAALKDGGLIALVEFREEDDRVPIKPLHKMSKKQILAECKENGLKLAREYDKLPWQHLMFFERDPDWKPRD